MKDGEKRATGMNERWGKRVRRAQWEGLMGKKKKQDIAKRGQTTKKRKRLAFNDGGRKKDEWGPTTAVHHEMRPIFRSWLPQESNRRYE